MIDYLEALKILNNWRASHSYPLNTFQSSIRTRIKKDGLGEVTMVAQRLKRISSILEKLSREGNMRLSRMQDIGGIRVILPDLEAVDRVANGFRKSRMKHEFVRECDYIKSPKDSGYRGIHLVYRYKNKRAPEYNDLRIEVQIRNELQHSWATAVEVVGAFLGKSLKSSEGPEGWLKFFSMVGSAFALMEDCSRAEPYLDLSRGDFLQEISSFENELSVEHSLKSYGSLMKMSHSDLVGSRYYIIHMKPDERRTVFRGFLNDRLEDANDCYAKIEEQIRESRNEQVVLVSGLAFDQLKKAYPNYFLNSQGFLSNLKKLKKYLAN